MPKVKCASLLRSHAGTYLCDALHAFPLEVQKLLDEVPIHKVPAICGCMLILKGAPICVAEAAHTLDDPPQAILQARALNTDNSLMLLCAVAIAIHATLCCSRGISSREYAREYQCAGDNRLLPVSHATGSADYAPEC